ncbi:MAG: glycosyltransferase family 9 protein [Ginsengibacter sp.]
MKEKPSHILISRTDSIGDVVLTLPVAKVLKDYFPGVKISFLGKNYTKAVIDACVYVDEFVNVDDFLRVNTYSKISRPDSIIHVFPVKAVANRAKELRIPVRIGTTNRLYHWLTCNRLVKLSRQNSDLHEAQLNLKLLKGFDIKHDFSLKEIENAFGLKKMQPLKKKFADLLHKEKYNLIIHPKSKGSAKEWGLKNFIELTGLLDKNRYNIFISGTKKEREVLQPLFEAVGDMVTDITEMNLEEFISFIAQSDGMVANSTGPLQIAGTMGKYAYGIFPPLWPITPVRFGPLGGQTRSFVIEKNCSDCKNNSIECSCIQQVDPLWIKAALDKDCAVLLKQNRYFDSSN